MHCSSNLSYKRRQSEPPAVRSAPGPRVPGPQGSSQGDRCVSDTARSRGALPQLGARARRPAPSSQEAACGPAGLPVLGPRPRDVT